MKLYTTKFSNGLYIRNPFFSFDKGLEMGFTSDLNKARLLESFSTAERYGKNALDQCEQYPETYKDVAGCTYEVIEVKIVEA